MLFVLCSHEDRLFFRSLERRTRGVVCGFRASIALVKKCAKFLQDISKKGSNVNEIIKTSTEVPVRTGTGTAGRTYTVLFLQILCST